MIMTDGARYLIMNELMNSIGSLQAAYAYVLHAEQTAREDGAKGVAMRLGGLRRQINMTADHAAIIRESLKN